jgi:hypothetical protein
MRYPDVHYEDDSREDAELNEIVQCLQRLRRFEATLKEPVPSAHIPLLLALRRRSSCALAGGTRAEQALAPQARFVWLMRHR